jgi:hypothetical protein
VPIEDQRFPMRRGPGTDQRHGTTAATGPRPPDISGAPRPGSGLDQPGMAWSIKPSPRQSHLVAEAGAGAGRVDEERDPVGLVQAGVRIGEPE